MSTNKLFKQKVILVALLGAAVSANASLYVSPVTKESASVNYVNNVVSGKIPVSQHPSSFTQNYNGQRHVNNSNLSNTGNLFAQAMQQDQSFMNGEQNINGGTSTGYGMSFYNQSPTILMNQGKDIPLFVAVEGIVPDISSWMIHYDEGMHNLDMTWSGGDTWEGVLNTLAMQNQLFVEINHAERVIGLGRSANVAKHLAKKVPTVWRVDTTKSLRENLAEWAGKAGWELAWDKDLMIDYPVEFNAVFTGELVGEDGAIDSILSSYRHADVPLKVKFFKKNKVVFVTRGGFEQELSF